MTGYGASVAARAGGFLLLLALMTGARAIQGIDVRVRRDDTNIKVTTKEEPPYLSVKSSGSGNDRYTGFIPELMKQIAARAKLKYELTPVADGLYGMKQANGEWSGMIGEIIKKKADLAAAPITISEERKKVVQFTEPFMNITTTILVKRPAEGEKKPFSTVQELANQNEIHYGLVKDGMTQAFFQHSTDATYKKMWEHMSSHPDNIKRDVADGVTRVRNSDGKYAFIMESSTADYWIAQHPCELMKVGDLGYSRAYAFATSDKPELLRKVNDALKALKGNGELKKLKDKWWKADKVCQNGAATVTSHVLGLILSFLVVCLL